MPLQRYFTDAHEAPGREFDGLSAGEDGLDDIGRQKGELHGAADLARPTARAHNGPPQIQGADTPRLRARSSAG